MKNKDLKRRKFIVKSLTGGTGAMFAGGAAATTWMTRDYFKFPDLSTQITAMPNPAGNNDSVLTSDNSKATWDGHIIPSPIGKNGKVLTSDGNQAVWMDEINFNIYMVGDILKTSGGDIDMSTLDTTNFNGTALGEINLNGVNIWTKPVYYTVESDTTDLIIENIPLLNKKSTKITITIQAGVTIRASSASNSAIRTGTGYRGRLIIINNGTIYGHGGIGGDGGRGGNNSGKNGGTGSSAILAEVDLTIQNNGTILGGGGGGGGGGGYYYDDWDIYHNDDYGSGGGGGGGGGFGTGGTRGTCGSNCSRGFDGNDGGVIIGGSGGSGVKRDGSGPSGSGGKGGDMGLIGSNGGVSPGYYSRAGSGGIGGAAGLATTGSGVITYV